MKTQEQQKDEDARREQRFIEQYRNQDFDYGLDGEREICYDCGSYLNSHGHCPNCDY